MQEVTYGTWQLALVVIVGFALVGYLMFGIARGLYDLVRRDMCRRRGHDWSYTWDNAPDMLGRLHLFCDRCEHESHVDIDVNDFFALSATARAFAIPPVSDARMEQASPTYQTS